MVYTIVGILTIQILPAVEEFKGVKDLAGEVSRVIEPGQSIGAFDIGNRPSVVFYNHQEIVFLNDEKAAAAFLMAQKGYCFTSLPQAEHLSRYGKIFAQKGELAVLR